jgi:MFS transporter, UMF1 family
MSGLLWMLISLFFCFWVHARPGPPLPKGSTYIGTSVSDVIKTFRHIRQLPETFYFLVAFVSTKFASIFVPVTEFLPCRYFLASDGWNTIGSVGVLFATQELHADAITLGVMLVIVPFCAFLGNFVWMKIKAFFKISTINMLCITITAMTALPVFGLLMGTLPFRNLVWI